VTPTHSGYRRNRLLPMKPFEPRTHTLMYRVTQKTLSWYCMDTIRKGSDAFKKDSTRRMAKRLVSYGGGVRPQYFDHLWKNRDKNGNYTIWNWKNGRFSGFAFVDKHKKPRHWKIELIGANQGHGIGRTLLNEIKRNAVQAGVQFLNLNSVNTAVGFYVKQGFTKNFKREGCTRMHCSTQRNRTLSMNLRPRKAPTFFSVKPRVRLQKKYHSQL
jgi:GNAT superfamily N-acetyltransferase